MNKEYLDTTVSVYMLGIREGFKRAAAMIREDVVKKGKTDELYDTAEYFAGLLIAEAGPGK